MNISKDERGFIGIVEVGLIVLLVGVIGFTGVRVYNAKRSVDAANDAAVEVAEKAAKFDPAKVIKVEEEKETEQVEKTEDEAEVEKEIEVEVSKPTTTVEEKPKPTNISLTLVEGAQVGENVVVSSQLASNQTGTCNFKFRLEGYEKIYKSVAISNTNMCAISVPVGEFPASGEWSVYTWFVNSNKTVEAYQDTYGISVTL